MLQLTVQAPAQGDPALPVQVIDVRIRIAYG